VCPSTVPVSLKYSLVLNTKGVIGIIYVPRTVFIYHGMPVLKHYLNTVLCEADTVMHYRYGIHETNTQYPTVPKATTK
jgi:hypothetical protein